MAYVNGFQDNSVIEQKFPRMGMSDENFRKAAEDVIEYIIKYYNTLDERQAFPSVQPGFMRKLLPQRAESRGGDWEDLLEDFDDIVLKGLTHWQSSKFLAFFPAASSYPSILADILANACSSVGFSWVSCPSCTELESIVLDWLAKAIGLPDIFLCGKNGLGVIQGSACEATVMTLLSARTKTLKKKSLEYPELSQHEILSKLVAYSSRYSHSSVEKACLIAMVSIRKIPVDKNISMRGEALREAIEEDKAAGKIPFYVCATLGTTDCVSFDNLEEIGQTCESENIWVHVDAAYAGNSFVCPEHRYHMKGVEMVQSFNFNLHKWLHVNFGFSALWVRNSVDLTNSLKVNPHYLRHDDEDQVIDYRHCQIPLSRRFQSLKLWFVFRLIGIDGMRHRIRQDVALAKLFESLVRTDERFDVVFPVKLGLVCIRLLDYKEDIKKNKKLNRRLFQEINDSKEIYLISSEVENIQFLRISTGSIGCDETAIRNAWAVIQKHAASVLQNF